jgi:hypothetical protein
VKDIDGHRLAAERQREISNQRIDWNAILVMSSREMHDALEKSISDAECLSANEKNELRNSIAEELADLREWAINRRLRRPEIWFGANKG